MIISIGTEKAFYKIQYPFLIFRKENSAKQELTEELFQFDKSIFNKLQLNFTFNEEILDAALLGQNKARMSLSVIHIQYSTRSPTCAIRHEKEIKGIQMGRKK